MADLRRRLRAAAPAQRGMVLARLRRLVPESRRRAREQRLTARHAGDDLPGLGRQQLYMDRSWHQLVPPSEQPSRRLLLVHVPKTGGTSLRRMLEDHVPAERSFLSSGAYQWADAPIRDLSRRELFVGHNFLEPLYLLPGDDWVTVLVVREPMAWWRSRYTYRRTRAEAGGDDGNLLLRQSMGDWLDGCTDAMLSNGQTSWLLARVRVMFDNPHAPDGAVSATGKDLARDPGAALDLLDRLLGRVTVLGVTQDLQDAYEASCRAMGWSPRHATSVRHNVSDHDAALVTVTDLQEERLRNLNVLDQYLYDRAVGARLGRGAPATPEVPRATSGS